MSKVTTLQLVQDLSLSKADATASERYYRDVVLELARDNWLVNASLIPATAGSTSHAMPANSVDLLTVFYDDTELGRETLRSLESYDSAWRDRRGVPIAYVTEDEPERTFRIVPTPEVKSKDFIFIFGMPLGVDFPEYAVAAIHSETRVDLPEWLELPVAFKILSLEFSRESAHRDDDFAAACQRMSALLLAMVT